MSLSSLALLFLLSWSGGSAPAPGVARDRALQPWRLAIETAPPAARDQHAPDSPQLWSPELLITGEDSTDDEQMLGSPPSWELIVPPSLSVVQSFAVSHFGFSRRTSRSPILRC